MLLNDACVWLILKMGTSVFHCSCPTNRDLSKQFCLLIPAINKITVLKEAFWQFKYSLEKPVQGSVGLLQGQKSHFFAYKEATGATHQLLQWRRGVIFCCLSMHGELLKLP